ncbi:MAG: helix-turn-helix transcriptional regulator [Chloroflexi bacterium]|nr:helix-turn-helix transcriptional regulator [Chloroflexota bacterium]
MATTTTTPGGAALRELRIELGLTQDQLSVKAHVNQGHISLIENGRRPLTAEIAMRICRRCNVDPGRLLPFVELGGYLTGSDLVAA